MNSTPSGGRSWISCRRDASPRRSVGASWIFSFPFSFLVPTLPRGNADPIREISPTREISRSHAPAWERGLSTFSFHAPAWKRKRHQVTRRYLLPRATWARRGCYIFLCSERDYTCGCVSGSVPTQERRYE